MKKKINIKILISCFMAILVGMTCISCSTSNDGTTNSENYIPIVKMAVSSSGIKNGIIDPQYGAASTDKLGAMPLESIPLQWSGAPATTKSYAVTIVDYDTVPIMGFPWIHWISCDMDPSITSLPANASTTMASKMTQGYNSYADGFPLQLKALSGFQVPRANAVHYGGMVPVNFAHKYTMKVYALDTVLSLKEGYGLNDLINAMEGHIVGEGVVYGTYNAKITKI